MKIVFLDRSTFQRSDESFDYSRIESLGQLITYDETPDSLLKERAGDADVVITIKNRLFSEQLNLLPKVRLICKAGSGYDAIDVREAKTRGIGVCNLPGYGNYMVAQWTWNLLMSLASNVRAYDREIRRNEDWNALSFSHRIVELKGKTLGLVGNSAIGRQVASWASAFDMKVLVYSRFPEKNDENQNLEFVDLFTLAEQSDFVSIHSRLDQHTRGMIGREFLKRMRPTSYLINTARAAIVDQTALMESLTSKRIAGAAFDVFWEEPLSLEHPICKLDNVILTPHMAWGAFETRQRMIGMLGEAISGYFSGKPIYLIPA